MVVASTRARIAASGLVHSCRRYSESVGRIFFFVDERLKIISVLSSGTHQNIRQTKPEGYVYQDPDTGQFVKAIDQANWAPRKD